MAIIYQDIDVILPFGFKTLPIRGKILRLNNVTEKILTRFPTCNAIDKIFLDGAALAILIASNIKYDGTFKLQINCAGLLQALLIDVNQGDIRGLIHTRDSKRVAALQDQEIPFQEIVKDGAMLIHVAGKRGTPYQTAITLKNCQSMTDVAHEFFKISEQINTYIKITADVASKSVALLFLQTIPQEGGNNVQNIENNDFNTFKILAETLSPTEMLQDNFNDVLYRLFHQYQVVSYEKRPLQYKCSCATAKIKELMDIMPKQEGEESPVIECSFCGKKY